MNEVIPQDCVRGTPPLCRANGVLVPTEEAVQEAIRVVLRYCVPNLDGETLAHTPGRVARALAEMTSGYRDDPAVLLGKVFEESYDEIVILRACPFTSLCSHHLLVFSGTVDIGYLPGKKGVVGLSKLARLVDCFARRLQVQERMTRQIAEALVEHLGVLGVAVVVRAQHSCMGCRGVKKTGAEMVTSSMLGVFRDRPEARAEFLALTR